MAAQYVIEDLAGIPVRVELASEFRYRSIPMSGQTLVIVISQSGETADSLAALRMAKEKGVQTLAIVNVVGSTIAREADHVLYTLAGPEIAVATTKAYSAQLIAADVLAIHLARVRGQMTGEEAESLLAELARIPDKITRVLEEKERLQWFSSKMANTHDIFFIGRGLDYAISLEGSLKMKEISYIHSEAYAAGELKHGTISLIENNTLVIGVLTRKELYEKDRIQYDGMQVQRRVPDGDHDEREFRGGGFREFHGVYPPDGRTFYGLAGGGAAAAAGILHEREPRPGRGQAEEPGEERYRGMIHNSQFIIIC